MSNIKFTRAQYMSNECTHAEYYAQYVTQSLIDQLVARLGKAKIVAHVRANDMSHPHHIPLQKWDNLTHLTYADFKRYGDAPSVAGRVCILKAAARQIEATAARTAANK